MGFEHRAEQGTRGKRMARLPFTTHALKLTISATITSLGLYMVVWYLGGDTRNTRIVVTLFLSV